MSRLRVASVCSGIGGAELAFNDAVHVFASEIEAFPRAVLRHHYLDLHIHGDFTKIPADAGPIDVLVGGTPCQSFSVAGLRGGMADERGNLALEYLRLAQRLQPTWVLWENVPGVLSSSDGRDFGAFVGGLAELGYGWAYRILDAQYFGLAQRRQRVFVVGCLGDWRRAAAVLFEPSCLRGHPPPRREAGQRAAGTLSVGAGGSGGHQYRQRGNEDALIAATLTEKYQGRSNSWAPWNEADNLIAGSLRGNSWGDHAGDESKLIAGALQANGKSAANATTQSAACGQLVAYGGNNTSGAIDIATTVNAHGGPHGTLDFEQGVRIGSLVRRLTPTECERLQGFPDGWTDVPYRGKPAADGPRYRALGNAFAVPVVRWIARRIAREHADIAPLAEAAD